MMRPSSIIALVALVAFNAWAILPDIGQAADAIFRFDFMIVTGFILAVWALVRTAVPL